MLQFSFRSKGVSTWRDYVPTYSGHLQQVLNKSVMTYILITMLSMTVLPFNSVVIVIITVTSLHHHGHNENTRSCLQYKAEASVCYTAHGITSIFNIASVDKYDLFYLTLAGNWLETSRLNCCEILVELKIPTPVKHISLSLPPRICSKNSLTLLTSRFIKRSH